MNGGRNVDYKIVASLLPSQKKVKKICSEIFSKNKTDAERSEIEDGDMFQSTHYCGGYEDGVFSFGYFGYPDKTDR